CLMLQVILAMPPSSHAQNQPKDRAKLVEDAKKEGKVVVYASSNASDAKALKTAFERKYPFVTMEFYTTGKDALLSRYLLEARTGTYLADVYQSSVFPIMNLLENGLLARYFSPEREAYLEALKDKDGYWNASYLNAITMAYNTRLLKPEEVPASYQDLLLPKWKGKMGFVLSHTEWYFAMLQLMGEEKGHKYMEASSKQNVQARIGSSLMNQLMLAGEFPFLVSQLPSWGEGFKKNRTATRLGPLGSLFCLSHRHSRDYKKFSPSSGATLCRLHSVSRGTNFYENPEPHPGSKGFLTKPATADGGP